jgi:hypothetical protein
MHSPWREQTAGGSSRGLIIIAAGKTNRQVSGDELTGGRDDSPKKEIHPQISPIFTE